MATKLSKFLFLVVVAFPARPLMAQSLDEVAQKELETVLASALVLNDSDAVTFGALSFDPGRFLSDLGDDFGSDSSLSKRRSITTFNLPWHYSLNEDSDNDNAALKETTHTFRARLGFLELKQDVSWQQNTSDVSDRYKSRVFSVYGGYQLGYSVGEHWRIEGDLGLQWQYYDNQYDYQSTQAQVLSGDFEGVLFNNSARATTLSASGAVIYQWQWAGLPWQWQGNYTYYRGTTTKTSDTLPEAEPEAWTLTNGITVKQPLPKAFNQRNRLTYSLRRIDLSGDITRTFGTHNYYRLSVGWLIQTDISWLKNAGVTANLNIGSTLSGGALELNYNEPF